jgi:hypothetical protein
MSKEITHRGVAALVVMVLAFALGGSAVAKNLGTPTVTSISPSSAQPGMTVTITGTNLTGATVTFRRKGSGLQPVTATQAETTISPDGTRILLTIPDGSDAADGLMALAGANRLVITTPGGMATASFTVLPLRQAAMKPIITGITPRHARSGRTVTIIGAHLSGAKGVWLSGMKATFKVPSASKILAIVPKHAKSGRWTVRTDVGTTSSALRFTVLVPSM